ncbi:uncharacterized protein [Anser cygnoides]|uniref:uncharacterized protein n=1 Tax=Anser cygnoides TaxID=8845 RepID=UPI0034D182AA
MGHQWTAGLLRQDVLLASPGPGDSWKCHLLGGRCKVGPLSCSLVPASHTAPFRQSLNFYSVLVESGADATRMVLISGSPPAPGPLPFAMHQAEQGKQRSTYSERRQRGSISPASASAAPCLPLRVPCPITKPQRGRGRFGEKYPSLMSHLWLLKPAGASSHHCVPGDAAPAQSWPSRRTTSTPRSSLGCTQSLQPGWQETPQEEMHGPAPFRAALPSSGCRECAAEGCPGERARGLFWCWCHRCPFPSPNSPWSQHASPCPCLACVSVQQPGSRLAARDALQEAGQCLARGQEHCLPEEEGAEPFLFPAPLPTALIRQDGRRRCSLPPPCDSSGCAVTCPPPPPLPPSTTPALEHQQGQRR